MALTLAEAQKVVESVRERLEVAMSDLQSVEVALMRLQVGGAGTEDARTAPAPARDDARGHQDIGEPCHAPGCRGKMVKRVGRKGPNAGQAFLGCSTFMHTSCKATRDWETGEITK